MLVGDAFATSCPAAGTGCNKVFTDAERLCHVHVPRWLAEPGMGAEKIAAFYDDEVKLECDAACLAKALYLRSLSIETGAAWHARRWLALSPDWAPDRSGRRGDGCGAFQSGIILATQVCEVRVCPNAWGVHTPTNERRASPDIVIEYECERGRWTRPC